uniref:DNA-3-methyladenine glycosylase I n=1 Tax=Davidia involucrata TaxID=16924 RepID=A0A5B7AZG5_DAVIN
MTLTNSHINGRPVLQPATCNRVPLLEGRNSLKKKSSCTILLVKPSVTPAPISTKLKTSPAVKRSGNDPNGLNSSVEKVLTPRSTTTKSITTSVKKSKKSAGGGGGGVLAPSLDALKYSSSLIVDAPAGSIAAARREQVAIMQVQRKMRIAHYGRTKSASNLLTSTDSSSAAITATTVPEEKRCSFITPNSDPIYVAYHDEEWGVPVHDDKLLFELLVLTGAQVGSDWTSVLKKRQDFRDAFSGFDAEIVSKFTERKITSINADYGIDLSQVRGVVDNSKRILEIKRELGSFDKYLWGFVNHKPIGTQYKSCHKIPVKTSKSEAISKDMVRRGFRLVGPTVMHSFMQAAGLTNDHLITCPRHIQCVALLAL